MAARVRLAHRWGVRSVAAVIVCSTLAGTAGACSGRHGLPPPPGGPCPVAPIAVVVSVAQWSDIVVRLAGRCGRVSTIVGSSVSDPHDFEPAPSDIARFADARLVVLNGVGYDDWARRALEVAGRRPTVVDAGVVAGRRMGDNPHLWYAPDVVRATADAVSSALRSLIPGAGGYLAARRTAWVASLAPYDAEIARVRSGARGRVMGATEPVFDDMAAAVGLRNATPPGYRRASLNGSEPSPVDVAGFLDLLDRRRVDVLVDNTQTEGALSGQLVAAATHAHIPVVAVTETIPASATSFVSWQVGQLRSLARALGA